MDATGVPSTSSGQATLVIEIAEDPNKLKQLETLLEKAQLYSQFLQASVSQPERKIVSLEEENADVITGHIEAMDIEAAGDSTKSSKSMPLFESRTAAATLPQPDLVKGGELRPYQLEGFTWITQLYENGMSGILADEMGLGKTVMTITFIAHLWSKGVHGPFIIVGPVSTLQNWKNEFERWTPDLPVILYHGKKEERLEMQPKIRAPPAKRRKQEGGKEQAAKPAFPIVITSYEIAINDSKFLQPLNWKYLIVDEGHRLKNFNSKLIRELRVYKTGGRLLLTGTPLQNNLSELWSLLNFILPDIFDSLDNFQSWFDFDEVLDSDPTTTDEARRAKQDAITTQLVAKLHTILQPFLLRRLKAEVKNLNIPVKKQVVVYCPFAEAQKVFYDLVKMKDFDAIRTTGKIRVSNIMMQLRKICNHPFLFDEIFDAFYEEWQANTGQGPRPVAAAAAAPSSPKKQKKEAAETPSKKRKRGQFEESEDSGPTSIATHRPKRKAARKAIIYDDNDDRWGLSDEDEEEKEESSDVSNGSKNGRGKRRNLSIRQSAKPASAASDDEDSEVVEISPPETRGEESMEASEVGGGVRATAKKAKMEALARAFPKRAMNAFMVFCQHKRNELKERGVTYSMIDSQSEWAAQWKSMSAEEKADYVKRAEEDKMKYLERMQAHKSANAGNNVRIDDPAAYVASIVNTCGKMQLVNRMLPRLRADGHKVLIFSQFTRMLDILEDYLEYSGYTYCRIDGSSGQKDRQASIDKYNADPNMFCFLLSTRAGGLGINLTSADTVIIYDSDWNPQMDLQAQDRCHRFGQERPVIVYRLATANSVESKILHRANAKLKLERLIVHRDSFKGVNSNKSNKIVSETDMLQILKDDGVDGVLGSENSISEADLERLLNRQVCLKMFETNKQTNAASAVAVATVATAAAAAAAESVNSSTSTNKTILNVEDSDLTLGMDNGDFLGGFSLMDEQDDGQGKLFVT